MGGGISQTIGGRFSISIFILWDVTQNMYSPYINNPILNSDLFLSIGLRKIINPSGIKYSEVGSL